jgi:hypothetical protein
VGPRAGLDRCGKSRPTGIRSPDRPARSSVAIPIELPGPSSFLVLFHFYQRNFLTVTYTCTATYDLASVAKQMRTALFWDITQQVVLIP